MDKEQLKLYLNINHHFMTVQEMAAEVGESYHAISYLCKKYGFKPITVGERVLEFITKNTHLSIDEQAEKLNIEVSALREHYYKTGTPLPPEHKSTMKRRKLSPGAEQFINDTIDTIKTGAPINRKKFTVYNQSGSDLLDEYRGIKTTERNDKLLL